jgi:hypothetical protein
MEISVKMESILADCLRYVAISRTMSRYLVDMPLAYCWYFFDLISASLDACELFHCFSQITRVECYSGLIPGIVR